MRPRASPRIAGTAAWPSDTVDAPATFSSICVRFTGCRAVMSVDVRSVIPLPGAVSIHGAAPAVTLTVSETSGATSTVSGPFAGRRWTSTGRM